MRILSKCTRLPQYGSVRLMKTIETLFPAGHFYSPICDPDDLIARQKEIWPELIVDPTDQAIDYRIPQQLAILEKFAAYVQEIDFPVDPPADPRRYFYTNDQYPCLDAEALYCFMRYLTPRSIVEVGSGFSTLIMAELNRRKLQREIDLTCVEPYPRQFLIDGVPGVGKLLRERVQSIGLELFTQLQPGDILFIDSSHVSISGSDVNYLFFHVLPVLAPGVYVHIHDIFLPDDYPKRWAIEEGRNWNEQYVMRAFLQFNHSFEIVWGSYLLSTRYAQRTASVFSRFPRLGGGGSLWLRRSV